MRPKKARNPSPVTPPSAAERDDDVIPQPRSIRSLTGAEPSNRVRPVHRSIDPDEVCVRKEDRIIPDPARPGRVKVIHDVPVPTGNLYCKPCGVYFRSHHEHTTTTPWEGEKLTDDYDVHQATLLGAPFRSRIPDPSKPAGYRLSAPYIVKRDGTQVPVSGHQSGKAAHDNALRAWKESIHAVHGNELGVSGVGHWDHEEEEAQYRRWGRPRHIKRNSAVADNAALQRADHDLLTRYLDDAPNPAIPSRELDVYLHHVVMGLSRKQTATALGLSVNTVGTLYDRIRSRARHWADDPEFGQSSLSPMDTHSK